MASNDRQQRPTGQIEGRRSAHEYLRLWGLRLLGQLYPRLGPPRATPRSLLLIRPDHLGDMLFLTPALHALRTALPHMRITLLAGPWGAGVIKDSTDLNEIITCQFPGFERRAKGDLLAPYRLLQQTARLLAASRYDTAVVLRHDHWWGAWLAAAAGIPRRIGYEWPETRPFLSEAIPYRSGRHEVEQNGILLAALAPSLPQQLGQLRYVVGEQNRAWAEGWLRARGADPARPLVAIHAGAGAAVKQWPPVAWAAVADELAAACNAQILLTGEAAEKALVRTVADAASIPVLNAAGETTLGQLAALEERCALVVGSDCGPLHLAVAMGVPTVHLYGPASSRKFGPWGDPGRHVTIVSDWPCVPCNRLDWPLAVLEQHGCMAAITPEQVLAVAKSLLREI
jgi:lipopolysaccharide heptosyltransferase II